MNASKTTNSEINTEIPVKVVSQSQIRAKIQTLLEDNMQQANGRFHCKELNEYGFLNDLFKKFTLTPKQ